MKKKKTIKKIKIPENKLCDMVWEAYLEVYRQDLKRFFRKLCSNQLKIK